MPIYPSIDSYVDDQISNAEFSKALDHGLVYVGHKLMVPNKGDYFVLPSFNQAYVLVNTGESYRMLSNVCSHRQALLLEGKGNVKSINCRLHCWGFDLNGKLKLTPLFKDDASKADLASFELKEWNGLLFKSRTPDLDLKTAGLDEFINFEGFEFAGYSSEKYSFNWKVFMEIYLENYHVFSIHPGLKKYVSPTDLEWQTGSDYSIQKVGLAKFIENGNTELYTNWQQAILEHFKPKLPRYGAIWSLLYPNIMIEHYPNIIAISTVHPIGAKECLNQVEFYYPSQMYQQKPDYFDAMQKAYAETAAEDNEACTILQKGREALYHQGEKKFGPIESFLEKGVQEFYNFLAR
ncbi:MAG: SRPBCC family protein [Bdellovibrionota bacterium]|nr:SRPBCC family protein [Bdellovibrionota bacterium]